MNFQNSYIFEILDNAFIKFLPEDESLFLIREDISAYEGNYFFESFKNKTWRDIVIDEDFLTIKKAFLKNKTFAFFTAVGFSYYLPAFILYFSEFKDKDLMQSCFFNLTPGKTDRSMDQFGEIFCCFTDVEIDAIKRSLEALDKIWKSWGEKYNEAGSALEQYWNFV